jgi:hypothetical protein
MSRSFSSGFVEELNAQEMSAVPIVLLEISHASLTENIYLSSDPTVLLPTAGVRGTVSNYQEYVFFPFELTLQSQTDELLARAKIIFDNVDRSIMLAILEASGDPPMLTIRLVSSLDTDVNEMVVPNLRLDNIKANAFRVEADLMPVIIQGEQYPYKTFSQSGFPGVFGRV